MNTGQLISGVVLIVFGIGISLIPVFAGLANGSFIAWIYGIPALIIGLFILLNKKEDVIEGIKHKGGKK